MGIGNQHEDHGEREEARFSLPLMGIGNRHEDAPRGVAPRLSLPLMGIGNHHRGGRGKLVEELITPHGDRKHTGRFRRRRGSHGLITPHGDRKPPQIMAIMSPMFGSLPLMGIGNTAFRLRYDPATDSSLPLMGIGNVRIADCGSSTSESSLPLMGIGNPVAVVADPQREVLITPHGDRKPSAFQSFTHVGGLQNESKCWFKPPNLRLNPRQEQFFSQAHMPAIRGWTSSFHATCLRPGASVLRAHPC